jgi:serine-type anaerobic sulfatase-maturating enzyme
MFDSTLASFADVPGSLCVHSETCGTAVALEHNGDLYSCDHFVEPDYLLGNIGERHMLELIASPRQQAFGKAKRDSLPAYCRECDVRFACHGGCPKDRFTSMPGGEPGLHYLCQSYRDFFRHVDPAMRVMTAALRSGRHADEVMAWVERRDKREAAATMKGK